jgi:signal peptide peptidase SppA
MDLANDLSDGAIDQPSPVPGNGERRYRHVAEMVYATPWAILPQTLRAIVELIDYRVAGQRLSEEEIRERIGAGPARRPSQTRQGVAVLPLYGVIAPKATLMSDISGGTSLYDWRRAFGEALADPNVAAILIDVDSPGGVTDLVPEVAADIRGARGRKPIVAVANTMAASAAYWLAAQADELVVTPSGEVGSIGVLCAHDDISGLQQQMGVKTSLISAGKYKTEGNPFEPLSEEARAALQERVDEMYGMFTRDVAKGRRVTAGQVRDGFGEGRLVSALNAVKLGMADRVATLEQTLARMLQATSSGRSATAMLFAGPLPPHSTPVVDEPWDANAEVTKIPNDAGEPTLRRMYAWVDSSADPDTKAAYSFPHHRVDNGEPGPANVNGVRNALSRLPQSNVPEHDQPGVERHLQRHLDDFHAQQSQAEQTADRLRALKERTRAELAVSQQRRREIAAAKYRLNAPPERVSDQTSTENERDTQ